MRFVDISDPVTRKKIKHQFYVCLDKEYNRKRYSKTVPKYLDVDTGKFIEETNERCKNLIPLENSYGFEKVQVFSPRENFVLRVKTENPGLFAYCMYEETEYSKELQLSNESRVFLDIPSNPDILDRLYKDIMDIFWEEDELEQLKKILEKTFLEDDLLYLKLKYSF